MTQKTKIIENKGQELERQKREIGIYKEGMRRTMKRRRERERENKL